MRKSSPRTVNYLPAGSLNAERLARFREQMSDYVRGERLCELRDLKHLSQERAALDIGVSVKTLRAWEHGGKIRWENAKLVAKFYGQDPETLVSRELPDASTDGAQPTAQLSQLDRIEQNTEEILQLLRGEDEQAIAAAAELEALPDRVSQGGAARKRRVPGRPAKS